MLKKFIVGQQVMVWTNISKDQIVTIIGCDYGHDEYTIKYEDGSFNHEISGCWLRPLESPLDIFKTLL